MIDQKLAVNKKVYSNKGNAFVQQVIPIGQIEELLDIGCGAGDNAHFFSSKGIIIDGITLSKEEAALAQQFMRNVYIYNLENGLPNDIKGKKYDCILCSHVLEHICFPNKLLSDVRDILKQGGVLIVALPNLLHYASRLELLKGNFKQEQSGIWDYTHFRWYTFRSGQDLLKNAGFNVIRADVQIRLPFGQVSNKLPNFFKAFFKKVSPGLFGSQMIYVAKVKK